MDGQEVVGRLNARARLTRSLPDAKAIDAPPSPKGSSRLAPPDLQCPSSIANAVKPRMKTKVVVPFAEA